MQGFYSGVWNNAVTGKVLGSETGVAEPAATRKRVSRFADAGDDNVMTAVAKAPSPTAVDTLNVVNSDAKDSDAKNSAELLEAERAARMELVAAAKERYLQRRAGRVQ